MASRPANGHPVPNASQEQVLRDGRWRELEGGEGDTESEEEDERRGRGREKTRTNCMCRFGETRVS